MERGQTDVDALHILRVMLDQDPAAAGVRQAGADPQTIIDAVDERLPTPEENKGEQPHRSTRQRKKYYSTVTRLLVLSAQPISIQSMYSLPLY